MGMSLQFHSLKWTFGSQFYFVSNYTPAKLDVYGKPYTTGTNTATTTTNNNSFTRSQYKDIVISNDSEITTCTNQIQLQVIELMVQRGHWIPY